MTYEDTVGVIPKTVFHWACEPLLGQIFSIWLAGYVPQINMAKEMLVVESRVREALPEGTRLSSDALEGLDAAVRKMIENAVARCNANKRKTIVKEDF